MQKEVQKKYVELQLLNQQIKSAQEQFILLQQQLNELMNLEVSIIELKDIKKNSEFFSSIGSGILVSSKLTDNEHVLVNVGAGILIEKNINEAVDLIKSQIKNVNVSLESIREQLNNAVMYSEKLTNEVNEMSLKR